MDWQWPVLADSDSPGRCGNNRPRRSERSGAVFPDGGDHRVRRARAAALLGLFPREFGAILTLETKAVAQVVYHIICETIGWIDPNGRGGRREWVQLGLRDFELICGSKSQGAVGAKTALQKGYILRRPYKNGFEYSLRWKEQKD